MKKVLVMMIGFLPNPRIHKRINLEKKQFEVHLICWDRGSGMLQTPKEDGYRVHCINIKAGGDPIKRMIPYMIFSCKAKELLRDIKPDVIHVQGLDMLKIACDQKKRSNKSIHLIYEVADLHRLLVDKQKTMLHKAVQKYLKKQDKKYCTEIDLLIVTSKKYAEVYFDGFVPSNKIMYFPNVPDLSAFENYKRKENRGNFTVGYIGAVRYKEQMKNLVCAAKACDMGLLIAGYELEPVEIEGMCREYHKGEWIGRFDFTQKAAELYGRCDVMYSVYDADMANVKVALPNKLYEAIYCSVPLIVAKGTYLADIVEKWGIGIAVDHKDEKDTMNALRKLKEDTVYYDSLVKNCRLHSRESDLAFYNQKLEVLLGTL